ncbi:TIGR03557 family F420-dependent LLM class oxidoreductase [Mycobacterium sp. AZCC_0083]|uniref:TIGR03557 family F420-dependent LLM class oxidoreductase n=1 Tax=Mycobacterium sp. AZCC_0083 TaxID=2735882 RepID=UPI001618D5DA|nr:TIGR03557 family F420-dependent LLM class oxidoreductase [Mycobacterium sp. AZCC_0083]MBB5167588.1 G6PDH family F420-dependent oxidoreductase [Mycobacterium sp. AZCC_0083]
MELGLKLFAEGFAPGELVRQAVLAEQAGFDFVEISDHFHPWLDAPEGGAVQGHAGFAWSILGTIAARTERIRLGTGVTCPTVRYHPAIIAQAAATMAILSEDRFFLGIGSGERLNEHIVGGGWRSVRVRHEMLREALQIIRRLWIGGFHSFEGNHLRLEDARIYDLPETLPEIIIAASGPKAARIAADHGDGMFVTTPDGALIDTFRSAGGAATVLGEMSVGFDESTRAGLEAVARTFRWSGLGVATDAEIPRPALFDRASRFVRPADLAPSVAVGPDPEPYLALAAKYAAAGVTGLSLLNAGPNMDEFVAFAGECLLDPIHALTSA